MVATAGVIVAILANVALIASIMGRMGARIDAMAQRIVEMAVSMNEQIKETAARAERYAAEHSSDNKRDNAVIFERLDSHNQRLAQIEGQLLSRRITDHG